MNSAGMDSAETMKIGRKGIVVVSLPEGSASEVDDDGGDYSKQDKRNTESKRVRSFAEVAFPWLVWLVFVISNLVGASSAAMILEIKRAAPISLAGWRHQVSSIAMLPLFLFQWSRTGKFEWSKAVTSTTICLYLTAATAISGHFAFYLWSLNHTSLVHCLFLTSMSPIFVAIYTKLTGGDLLTGDYIGVSLGLVGVGVLAAGTEVEHETQGTLVGDSAALVAAVSMAAYLITAKKLRTWMPLFVFQFPVAVLACIILGTAGLLLEGWNDSKVGEISGLFGWLHSREYILGTIFLGVGPGIIGHAGYSFVLKYASPLVMPTGMSLQPILGSLIAWAVGESPLPSVWSCVGGAVTLTGTMFVSYASATRKAPTEPKEEKYKQPATDDEEGQQGTKPLLDS